MILDSVNLSTVPSLRVRSIIVAFSAKPALAIKLSKWYDKQN